MTRAEAEASDGSDIGGVNEVRVNHARGGSSPPALSNYRYQYVFYNNFWGILAVADRDETTEGYPYKQMKINIY